MLSLAFHLYTSLVTMRCFCFIAQTDGNTGAPSGTDDRGKIDKFLFST